MNPKHTIEELRNRLDLNREQKRELASALAHYDLAMMELQKLRLKIRETEAYLLSAVKSIKQT